MSDAHTARPHWLPASVCLARRHGESFYGWKSLTIRNNKVLWSLPCIIHSLCGHARKRRVDYCKIVRRSSVDWNVMCLSLELDFEKFKRENLMEHLRPHAHVPCRYRRPQHGECWCCCWSPLLGAARWKSKHVAETLLREFLSNACSPSCFDNLLRLEAPAHGDALGHDAVVDDGTRSSRHDIARFCGAFCAAGPKYGCRSTALLHERGYSRVAAQLGRELERRHRCQRDWQAGPRKLRSFEKCWLCRQSR